jgi:hypothetical protein
MMKDILIVLAFWAMTLGPCLVALHTGAHRHTEEA